MSAVDRIVRLIFEGDDRVSKVMSKIEGRIGSFSNSVESATQPFADVTGNVLKFDAALAALAVGGLAFAFTKSKEFESATIDLKKVIGDQPAVLKQMQDEATALSEKYGESATKILQSSADFAQAGFDTKDAMMLTKNAMDLVIAGGLEASEASNVLIRALKGFKEPASSAESLIAILNETSNKYATDVRQLGQGMADLSPIAKQMHFSFAETAGILTPVIEVFGSGSEAAQGLKTGLLKLLDDSKPVQQGLAALGVSQKDANGNFREGREIFYDVARAFEGLSENERLYYTQMIFGIEQSARLVEVFSRLPYVMKVSADAIRDPESALKEVEARLQSSEVAINRFIFTFENLSRTVGDQFRDAAKEAIDGGSSINQAIRDAINDGSFDTVFDAVRNFSKRLAEDFRNIAKNLPEALRLVDYSGFLNSLKELGGEIGNIFDGVDLSTPEGLADALQKVVDSLESLVRFTSGIADGLKPFINAIGEAINGVNNLDGSTVKSIGNVFGFATGINNAVTALNFMGPALSVIAISRIPQAIAAVDLLVGKLGSLGTLAAGGAAFGIGYFAGELLNKIPAVQNWAQSVFQATDRIINFTGTHGRANEMLEESGKQLEEARAKFKEYQESIKKTDELDLGKLKDELRSAGVLVEALTEDKKLKIDADLKDFFGEIDRAKTETLEWYDQTGKKHTMTVIAKADTDDAKKKIDEVATDKQLEIKLKGEVERDLAKIKAMADTVQASIEWEAKLDIAKVEANAKVVESMFNSIDNTISSTGNAISNLFSSLNDSSSINTYSLLTKQIRSESEMREETHEKQMKLLDAQTRILESRASAMERGKALYTIEAANLTPHLEAIWVEVVKAIQIRATEEGFEALIGL